MVCRGHGDAAAPLIPATFRKKGWDECLSRFCLAGLPTPAWEHRSHEEQIWCEFQALNHFLK
jgi:hypothetical protein